MNTWMKGYLSVALILALTAFCSATNPIFVIANQDQPFPYGNMISIYQAAGTNSAPSLSLLDVEGTGGFGIIGGFFGTARLNSVPSLSANCLYVSNAASNNISTFALPVTGLIGTFNASQSDDGSANGIGMALNSTFLYASYTASNTIATFALQGGCGLTFVGDVPAVGLNGGSVTGMAVTSRLLVVAYGDGSIQSFNVSGGLPVPNNDRQLSSGFSGLHSIAGSTGNMPSSVDITQDGHFAIFGDISGTPATVEVSNISANKLATTVSYSVGAGVNSGNARLSPDQSMIYIANSEGGTVTAAFFNKTTGKVTPGCISPTLAGFNERPWLGSVVTRDTSGIGSVLYVGEFGRQILGEEHAVDSAIGILTVTSNGTTCTLAESRNSPVMIPSSGTLSVGAYPPRPF